MSWLATSIFYSAVDSIIVVCNSSTGEASLGWSGMVTLRLLRNSIISSSIYI